MNMEKELVAIGLVRKGNIILERKLKRGAKITPEYCRKLARSLVKDGDTRMIEYVANTFMGSYAV